MSRVDALKRIAITISATREAVVGGTGGLLVGAAAGGLAGHELARNGRKHCR